MTRHHYLRRVRPKELSQPQSVGVPGLVPGPEPSSPRVVPPSGPVDHDAPTTQAPPPSAQPPTRVRVSKPALPVQPRLLRLVVDRDREEGEPVAQGVALQQRVGRPVTERHPPRPVAVPAVADLRRVEVDEAVGRPVPTPSLPKSRAAIVAPGAHLRASRRVDLPSTDGSKENRA